MTDQEFNHITSVSMKMESEVTRYMSVYLQEEPEKNSAILSRMEKQGWKVLNITGTSPGNDVIWFLKHKLS